MNIEVDDDRETAYCEIANALLDKDLLFASAFNICPDLQREIIRLTVNTGHDFPVEGDVVDPFWLGVGLTKIVNLPQEFKSTSPSFIEYYCRLNERFYWEWVQHPIVPLVQELLSPISRFFLRFTRITVVLQKPGMHLWAHRDLVPGETYDNLQSEHLTFRGDRKLTFKGSPAFVKAFPDIITDSHSKQNYLNLKIPLSTDPYSPGAPFVIWNGTKISYSSQNQLFFLNEALIEHGADKVNHFRGVVFVDGFLNLRTWCELEKLPVRVSGLSKMDYESEGRG